MAEPVDAPADFTATRGNQRAVTYAAKVPSTDSFAAAVAAVGVRGPKRVAMEGAGGGSAWVTRADWVVTGLAGRPTVNGKITDTAAGEVWVIEDVGGFDPWTCATTLA
jgi:hypothetical protein